MNKLQESASVLPTLYYEPTSGVCSSINLYYEQTSGVRSSVNLYYEQTSGACSSTSLYYEQTSGVCASLMYTGEVQSERAPAESETSNFSIAALLGNWRFGASVQIWNFCAVSGQFQY